MNAKWILVTVLALTAACGGDGEGRATAQTGGHADFSASARQPRTTTGYSTFLGGYSGDSAMDIALGSDGSAYVVGETFSSDFTTTTGAYNTTYVFAEAFVVKLNPDGSNVEFATFLGGSGFDTAMRVRLDAQGNIYVGGMSDSADFMMTEYAYEITKAAGQNAFVAKLNPTGSELLAATWLNDSTNRTGGYTLAGLGVDAQGAVCAGGATNDNWAYVVKLNASLSEVVYAALPSAVAEKTIVVGDVDADAAGNCYVAGLTTWEEFPVTEDAYDTTFDASSGAYSADGLLFKLSPTGATVFATFLGGSGVDMIAGLALADDGRVVTAGLTTSPDFPVSARAFSQALNDATDSSSFAADGFVSAFSSDGSALLASTYVGGSVLDIVYSVDTDARGNLYVTGFTNSPDLPVTAKSFDPTYNDVSGQGDVNVFAIKLNREMSRLQYGTYVGIVGGSASPLRGAVNPRGNFYLAGTISQDLQPTSTVVPAAVPADYFPTTPGAYDTTYNGQDDAFVTKLGLNGTLP